MTRSAGIAHVHTDVFPTNATARAIEAAKAGRLTSAHIVAMALEAAVSKRPVKADPT